MNRRPSGYEPDELPGCSTPHQNLLWLPLLRMHVPDAHPMAATLMSFSISQRRRSIGMHRACVNTVLWWLGRSDSPSGNATTSAAGGVGSGHFGRQTRTRRPYSKEGTRHCQGTQTAPRATIPDRNRVGLSSPPLKPPGAASGSPGHPRTYSPAAGFRPCH